MEVTVIRSPKRRKTAQARLVEGRLEVRIPARSTKAEEAQFVETFRRRFERAGRSQQIDLTARARTLARRLDLPEPTEIRWVTNQDHRWGSCTPSTGVIRISDRLAHLPLWVVDHVVVHELAHLVIRRHDARFRALVARYPLAERAEGFLIARSGSVDPLADPLADDEPPAEDGAEAGAEAGVEVDGADLQPPAGRPEPDAPQADVPLADVPAGDASASAVAAIGPVVDGPEGPGRLF
jgi:hypothetical protein